MSEVMVYFFWIFKSYRIILFISATQNTLPKVAPMKLRNKFFLIFSILAIIPLLIISIYAYRHYAQTIRQRVLEFSENLFQNAVAEANTTLSDISQTVNYMTFYSGENGYSIVETLKTFADSEDDFTSYDVMKASQYCNSVFQNLMVDNEYIHGIYIFTPTNVIFSSSIQQYSALKSGYRPEMYKWYQDTLDLEGRFYISSFTSQDMFTDQTDSIYFAKSIRDVYNHKFLGVVLIDCDPGVINLDNVNSMSDITLLTIANTKNSVVLYTNLDSLEKDFSRSNREVKKASLTISPLELTATFNYDALYKEFNLTGEVLLTIAFTCIFGYIILAYAFTKNLVRPLESLSHTMSRQRGGSFSFSSPYLNRTDEIGTLYNEYANMLEELDASIKRDYKDKLIILDAQMKSLEARINSHFLFNTLESINSMAELDDNEPIATMSLALGNMFRYSIKTQSELVTLRDELSHVRDYISIQTIRFSNRFSLLVDIPGELYDLKVLKLILQPLVENALYHGLNYCTRGDRIVLHARREDSTLHISVSDNGQGMPPEMLEALNRKLQEDASFTELGHRTKQSIGLKNIHSRIELYYGKGYGLQIASSMEKGTTITIRLPIL